MKPRPINKGLSTLRPRARIVRTIGRDLISNEVVALVELVKNAYDADAREVCITFEEPLQASQGAVCLEDDGGGMAGNFIPNLTEAVCTIEDDGVGMSLATVKRAWFEPATISKMRKTRTAGGRRVTGEKGIGRFAAARIAQVMDMETVRRGSRKMVRVHFDWGRFDDERKYLDEIFFRWEEYSPSQGRKHGTRLRLTELNDVWDKDMFENLYGQLSRLVPSSQDRDDFRIRLSLPEKFKKFSGIVEPPPILGRSHYHLVGQVDHKGKLTAKYTGQGGNIKEISKSLLSDTESLASGPFHFELRVWDRDDLQTMADELGTTVRNLRRDLDAVCGISIYRDNFRVLLGDQDWLRLDLRRVQNPTLRISNNQIVGSVYITADENPSLRDQSNREGMVSGAAFEDFKNTLRQILGEFEARRYVYREKKPKKQWPGLFKILDVEPLEKYVVQRYPGDAGLKEFFKGKKQEFKHGVTEVQNILTRYRRLATLGQLIDVVLHEGRTPLSLISGEIQLMKKYIDKIEEPSSMDIKRLHKYLDKMHKQVEFIFSLFNRLSPFGGRKRGRPVETSMEEIISGTFELLRESIATDHVKINLPEGCTRVTADPTEMQQIFLNLLTNSLYWLKGVKKGKREITVQISRDLDKIIILFSDNGPGVPEDVREYIFDPYFSTKPDGVGLGLTIAGETAAEYDGILELVDDGPLSGATFRIILRKRIGD